MKIQQEVIFSNGVKHIQEKCKDCGKHIKYIQQGEPKLFFGKYKGKTIKEISQNDPEYLQWLYNENIPANLKRKIYQVIKENDI